MPETVVTIVK